MTKPQKSGVISQITRRILPTTAIATNVSLQRTVDALT
jgi:hypothetical protein